MQNRRCSEVGASQIAGTSGYCVFIDTVLEGSVPLVFGNGHKPHVFATRLEAEREIADSMMTRLQEFMNGEREFDDAMTVEEFVVEVDVLDDGRIVTEADQVFG